MTLTATVTTAGTNPPTGRVTFAGGFGVIGTAVLSTVNGAQVATFTTSTLYVGSNYIDAFYSGDAQNVDSTSEQLDENIIAPTFTWTANGSTSGSVFSGQSASYNFIATPTGISTFALNVSFSCTAIATITCSFSPAQITAGSGPTPVQMTVTTAGPNQPGSQLRRRADSRSPWLSLALPLTAIATVGFARRRVSKRSAIASMFTWLALLGLLVACGGGGGGGNSTAATATAGRSGHGKSGSTGESVPERCRRQLAASNGEVYGDGRQCQQQRRNLGSDAVKLGNDRRERPLHSSHSGCGSSDKCGHHRDFGSRPHQIRAGHRNAKRSHDPHAKRATLHHQRVRVREQYIKFCSSNAGGAVESDLQFP